MAEISAPTLTSRVPASTIRYQPHVLPVFPSASHLCTAGLYRGEPRIASTSLVIDGTTYFGNKCAKAAYPEILALTARLPASHHLVYIDLEEHHTLGGVVAAILERARQFDSALMPLRLPVSMGDSAVSLSISVHTAVRRVREALRRSPIALILDGLEAFEWRPTTHHGFTSLPYKRSYLGDLLSFITALFRIHNQEAANGDSVVCVALAQLSTRHTEQREEKELHKREEKELDIRRKQLVRALRPLLTDDIRRVPCKDQADDNAMKRSLRENLGRPVDYTIQSPDSLFLALACTMRRSRSLSILRQLWDDVSGSATFAERAMTFEKLMDEWVTADVFYPLEGEVYAMDRTFRNELYSRITEATPSSIVASAIVTDDQERTPLKQEEFFKCVRQSIDASFFHDRCALLYFNSLYLPSQDSFHFLEYVYHRISGIRYLTNVLLMCARQEVLAADCERHLRGRVNELQGVYRISFDEPNKGVVSLLQDFRERVLRGLVSSWRRSEARLRETVPPDTLLTWCDAILEYDIVHQLGYDARAVRLREFVDCGSFDKLVPPACLHEEALADLSGAVRHTKRRCLYERGAFSAMLADSIDAIKARLGEPRDPKSATENSMPAIEGFSQAVRAAIAKNERGFLHDILDGMLAVFWDVFSTARDVQHSEEKQKEMVEQWSSLSMAVREHVNSGIPDTEARIRCDHILCEVDLGVLGGMGKNTVGEFSALAVAAPISDVQRRIRCAIDVLQEERDKGATELHDPFLNVTEDRSLLLSYRSLLHILLGRVTAQGARRDDSQREDMFKRAYRECEYARAGIHPQNRALFTLCELYAAETAIEHANSFPMDDLAGMPTMETKLRSARSYLDAARRSMSEGGRHVLLWRLLSVLSAKHSSLTVRAAVSRAVSAVRPRITGGPPSAGQVRVYAKEAGLVMRTVREGLQAIRDGLDHTPPSAERFAAALFEEWCHLLGGSFCFAVALVAGAERDVGWEAVFEQHARMWVHLNSAVGIVVNRGHWDERFREIVKRQASAGRIKAVGLSAAVRESINTELKLLWADSREEWNGDKQG